MKKLYILGKNIKGEDVFSDVDRKINGVAEMYYVVDADAERAKDKAEIARLREALELLRKRFVRKPYGSYWVCEYCNLTGWDYPRHERNCVFHHDP